VATDDRALFGLMFTVYIELVTREETSQKTAKVQTINEQDIGTNADWQKLIGEQYTKLSSTRDGYAYTNLILPVVEYDDIPVKLVLRIHADMDHAAEFGVLGRHFITCLLFEFLQNNCDEPKSMAEELMGKYFRLRWNTVTPHLFN
jgi:hypothetical protein